MNLLCLGVVVLAGVTKLFRVIRLCLTCAQWLGDSQHVLAYSKKSLCLRTGSRWIFWSSLCCCSFGTSFWPKAPFPDGGRGRSRQAVGKRSFLRWLVCWA